jgi:hypothetical protein
VEQDKEEDGFAHQVGKSPRKEPLFGGTLETIETGSDFGSPALLMMVVAKAIDLIGFASDTRRCGAPAPKSP